MVLLLRALLLLFFLVGGCLCGAHERRLLNELLGGYIKEARPTSTFDEPVVVVFGLDLQQIIDMDEQNQAMLSASQTRPNGKGEFRFPIQSGVYRSDPVHLREMTTNPNRLFTQLCTDQTRAELRCAALPQLCTYCTSRTVVLFGRLAEGPFI